MVEKVLIKSDEHDGDGDGDGGPDRLRTCLEACKCKCEFFPSNRLKICCFWETVFFLLLQTVERIYLRVHSYSAQITRSRGKGKAGEVWKFMV